jgi:hypothetical protein
MHIDLEHLHYWINSIRISDNPERVMDSFWRGQIQSKEWLITQLTPLSKGYQLSIDIFGGWNGVLASMLFQSSMSVDTICSIDIDPNCESVAKEVNRLEVVEGRFKAITADMCTTPSLADIVINTSCEHITQDQYEQWLSKISGDSMLVLQSNNYQIEEHVRIANSLEEFKEQCGIEVVWSGELELPLYTRYMIIGHKN